MEVQNIDVKPKNLAELYTFITPTFLANILKKKHTDSSDIIIEDYELNAAVPEGENFCSQMIRAEVRYSSDGNEKQSVKVIFKTTFTKDSLNARIEEINAFGKEIIMFSEIIPQVETLLRSAGDDVKLAARCYSTGHNPNYLCFEDLTQAGYANVDKNIGLSAKHVKALFTKLAKYHAGTARMLLDKKIDTTLFEKHPVYVMTGFMGYFENSLRMGTNAIAEWEGYEEITKKMRRLSENFRERLDNNVERDLNGFLVVTHGDLWSNNTMFKMAENGDVEDVLMVDFQIGYWGSPIYDITYCLFMSAFYNVTEEEIDLSIQHYHRVLVETLKSLNYPMEKVPTLRQLRADMFRRFFFEIGYLLQMSAFLEKKLTFDLDTIFAPDDDNYMKKQQQNFLRPEFRKYSESWIKYMDRKGLLD